MTKWHRFMDWPLRAKMAALLVAASVLPLGVATWISIDEARERLTANAADVLAARGDQLVGRLDAFNFGYQRSLSRFARLPQIIELLSAKPEEFGRLEVDARTLMNIWPASDANIRGIALLDLSGTVKIGTEDRLIGVNLAYRGFVRQALQGIPVISDVYLADPAVGSVPTIAFLAPVTGADGRLLGLAAFWVRASALWNVMKASNELAGPGSFAVLFDGLGIRIAHTYSDDIVFHPGGRLAPATIEALVAEHRFGSRTRRLLEDVRSFPEQYQRSLAASPDRSVFRGFAPVNQKWNYGVGRRFETVRWTVFYMIPEGSLLAQIAQMTRAKTLFAAAIMLLALIVGALFATAMLRPIRSLSVASRTIAKGDLDARVAVDRTDELGILAATFNDMAERIQAQAAEILRESQAQYRALFQTLIEGFCTIEVIFNAAGKPVDYRFLEINPAFERQTGLRDAQGKLMRDLAPDHEEHWFEIYGKIALTGEPLHFENEAKALGRHYDVCAYRVGGPESRKVAILFNDITVQKVAQRKLQAQLERLSLLQQITRAIGERQDLPSIFQVVIRTLEDQLPIDFGCICLYDSTASELIVSRVGVGSHALAMDLALTEQARISIDENGLSRCVRGQLVYEPDVTDVRFPFPQRLARGGVRAFVAAPLLVESEVFGVLIAARRGANGFSSGECEFLRQLSEHVALAAHQAQLYGALQAAYVDLRQTQQAVMEQERLRALGQMASGIAHDINNAISPVALYTDSLLERETNLSAQGRGHLQTIQRAIEDVAATVARMREFYRVREPQLSLAPVQLNQLAQQVVELTRARWSDMPQQRGIVIELATELASDLPTIMGVESEIREALTNLVFNSVDAMPEGGTLAIRTRAVESGHVHIEVGDSGVGMDQNARRRCLEPFFTTKGERGTGLGLAMVYGMVQRHSADIEIDSALGKGTTVRLAFAVATSSAPAQAPPVFAVPEGLRILIVDDDPVLLNSLRDTLETDGHTIVAANGGREGIDFFCSALSTAQPFDVVITDLGMPYVDGRQVASAINAASTATPVIMLTGWGRRLVADGEIPAHVDLVLGKPPKLRDLREALARCCGVLKA